MVVPALGKAIVPMAPGRKGIVRIVLDRKALDLKALGQEVIGPTRHVPRVAGRKANGPWGRWGRDAVVRALAAAALAAPVSVLADRAVPALVGVVSDLADPERADRVKGDVQKAVPGKVDLVKALRERVGPSESNPSEISRMRGQKPNRGGGACQVAHSREPE
jgi:hypothetical protein